MGFHGVEQSAEMRDKILEEISETESIAIKERMAALDKFFAKRVDALYKIEVQFGKERSTWKPFAGAISLYLSGSKLHGGGDEKLYICPQEECRGIIFPNERLGPSVLCRKCEMMWDENDLVGEVLYRLTPKDWATVIYRFFAKLDHHSDIYLKYHPTDIRYQTEMELARQRGGEAVAVARRNRGLHIYPLANIIKDTSNGAQLYDRILSFITA